MRHNNSLPSFKTEDYESKIYELSNQVKMLRERLMTMEQEKHSSAEQQMAELSSLQVENARLMRQNKALRVRVHDLQQMLKGQNQQNADMMSVKSQGALKNLVRSMPVEGYQTARSFERMESGVTTTQLLRELLAECNQPSECGVLVRGEKMKDEFYQFKSSADCFQPWLDQLSKELKIRLKRCLTREKELLWSSGLAQLGCICPYAASPDDPPHCCRMLLVLTNLSPIPLSKIVLAPLHAKDVTLSRRGKPASARWQCSKELRANEQLREEVEIVVNNIDFRCVQLQLSFEANGQSQQELLILGLSKVKLFRLIPYTAPPKGCQRVERVFDFERKVLSEVDRIGKLWTVVEGKEKVGAGRYYWKISFLGRSFWIQSSRVEGKLMVGVRFQCERALAEKVLEQYVFLFQKL